MRKWIEALDSVLRGEATRLSRLRDEHVAVPASGLTVLIVLLGAFYGLCMGCFAVFNRESPEYMQLVASTIKVPALFILTLVVTLPSLYVFNALVGSRLGGLALLRLLVASLAVALAVLASFGPIVAFFSLTTDSYPFMKILNVIVFTVSGVLGLGFLLQTLHRLTLPVPQTPPPQTPATEGTQSVEAIIQLEPAGALERVPQSTVSKNVRVVFTIWIIVFGLVGAQMSWVLRPFIGAPDRPFTWFRARESNFFESVRHTLEVLLR